jgi:ACS family hexuronate transporter-like MFS transporter
VHGNIRWVICGLLFFATTVNYMDRQVLGILKPILERDMHWSETDYSHMVFAFQLAYALMMPIAGRLIDWLGVRTGYALAAAIWSLASMSTSLARTSFQFMLARFGLGLGESANFPAAIKAVAEWFPEKERALATGILNSGSNVGAMVAPLLVPAVARLLGWHAVFFVTGGLDLIWIAVWLTYFRNPAQHRGVSKAELDYIHSGAAQEPARRIPYVRLLGRRQAWAFAVGKFMTDPTWWFYLFWIPSFLNRTYGLPITQLGPPLIVIYVAADVGSILGGGLSTAFMSRGMNANWARKSSMLICALGALPVAGILWTRSLWPAVALISMAAAAHQGWSANLYTLVSDLFPKKAVGSVVGLGGFAGAISGTISALFIGPWLDSSHRAYGPLFVIAGLAYVLAFCAIQALTPRLQRASV